MNAMDKPLEELEAKIRTLTADEKVQLLRSLIAELDGPPEAEAERAWLEVAKVRWQEIVEGKVKTVPRDEVFRKMAARRGK